MAEKIVECQAENRELKEKVKVFEECRIDYLELKERVKVLEGSQAENVELKVKVKVLEEFVSAHIGPDAPLVTVTGNGAASVSTGTSYAAAVASTARSSSDHSPRSPDQIPNSNSNFLQVRNGAKRKSVTPIAPVSTKNSFGPLVDLVEEPEDSIIIGDSLIRNQLEEFCGRAPKCRKRYCFPGAKIDDITTALEEISSSEKEDSIYIVHVGTNDIKMTNSEELLEKYKRMIYELKSRRSKFMVSGILPRIGAESQFYSKAFSTNSRLKSLCTHENVEFVDLWNHFYDQGMLFNRDGLHLNPVGSARFGRLLNDALEDYRAKNQAQRGTEAPS